MHVTRILILLFIFAVCSGCSRPVREPIPVRIASTAVVGSLPIWVAMEQGFFARHGLAVTVTHPETSSLALEELATGRADFATSSDTVLTLASLKGQDLSLYATIASSSGGSRIAARRDQGIRSPRDVVGKVVGYTPRSSSDYFLHSFLILNLIPPDSIRKMPMGQKELQEALLQGKVDAAVLWNPHLSWVTRSLGERGVTFDAGDIYDQFTSLSSAGSATAKRPEVLRALLSALMDAVTFLEGNPEESIAILNRHVHDGSVTPQVLQGYHFDVALDQDLLVNFQTIVRWALEEGYVTQEQASTRNPGAMVKTDVLEKIDSSRVNIIQ